MNITLVPASRVQLCRFFIKHLKIVFLSKTLGLCVLIKKGCSVFYQTLKNSVFIEEDIGKYSYIYDVSVYE